MNFRLSYVSTAVILSAIVCVLTLVAAVDLKQPQPFYLTSLGVVLLINLVCYLLSRRDQQRGPTHEA